MTKITTTALALTLAVITSACGGDDDDSKPTSHDDSKVGLSSGPWDPESCSPQAQATSFPATCKQSDFDNWNECLVDACQSTYDTCFGKGRSTGNFSGACAPYAKCAAACKCSDTGCTGKCPGAQACADCYTSHVCGGDCKEPACALTAIGVDATKTCADLKSCCAGLKDAASAKQCSTSASMLDAIPGGAYSCAALYDTFKKLSLTCK
jgi:hypothetical protein